MLSAVYGGLFASDHASQLSVTPDCSTGNCTWTEPYATLGVCSKCYDITSSIQEQCAPIPNNTATEYGDVHCNYSLPHGLEIDGSVTTGTSMQVRGMPWYNTTEGTVNFKTLRYPLAIMYLLNVTTPPSGNSSVATSTFAAECALQYCVKKYNGSVSVGKLNETLMDTFFNESAQFDSTAEFNVSGYMQTDEYLSIQPPSTWLAGVSNMNSSFTVSASGHSNLKPVFITSDICSNEATDPGCPLSIFDGNVTATETESGPSLRTISDIPRHIYNLNFTGIEHMMENLAHGLTTAMRTSKNTLFPDANTPLSAIALTNKVIAKVRWGWFAVPATLLVLTLVFMLLTAWETRRRRAMLWKGSSFPAFYYPLTMDGRSQITDVASPRVMENTANAMKVKWQMTGSGMRLVKVD